jgi:3-dehydroquinate dehydratase-2
MIAQKYKIAVCNGPNLNLLGRREKSVYGEKKLDEIYSSLTEYSLSKVFKERLDLMGGGAVRDVKIDFQFYQSNHEGNLIDYIQQMETDGLIINPASLTHTSIGLRDVLLSVDFPFVEVHLSNIYARENFRHRSFLSDIASGVIVGFGAEGYILAFDALIIKLINRSE